MSVATNLRPYQHQVSGHACLMTTDESDVILKPLSSIELDFYANMPKEIRLFVPEFKGIAEITYKRVNGDLQCEAELPTRHFDACCKPRRKVRKMEKNDEVKIAYEGLERSRFDENCGFQVNKWTADKDPRADTSGVGQNPWAKRVQSHALNKLACTGRQSISCLLLENISCKFKHPCILDLKMGTRLHGDDCPRDKLLRHRDKNLVSTTSSLGVRLTGLQVYQNSRYICRDKFFGRGLSEKGFFEALRLFFHDGQTVRHNLVVPFLRLLEKLAVAVESMDNYRLFGASLVMLYEGKDPDGQMKVCQQSCDSSLDFEDSRIDVKLVDFAHCSCAKFDFNGKKRHPGSDSGFLFGLKTLRTLLRQLKHNIVPDEVEENS